MYYCSSGTYNQIEKVLKYKMTDERKKKWKKVGGRKKIKQV